MKSIFSIIGTSLIFLGLNVSCDQFSKDTKESINKGGEVVGQTATEFFEGVTKGVNKTLECKIELSEVLKSEGLQTGAFSIENRTDGGENNLLTLYLIFDKDFKGELIAKAYNKNDMEIGRSSIEVRGEAGGAQYVDFNFDKRTYIGVRNKIIIE
ncbi:hypothetical protein [Robertkochia solimangrovi]|uniref:hypothetical protein n=1 Tax=Robertkochia solimangrovi TaxID=2213046 RepID=UPI00117E9983|nr:hypothetical protein [Robertkochia solimangrovi]TRZ46321.1 hypothetical protein DMZ48_03435 [Robertkochia solimangrovi]